MEAMFYNFIFSVFEFCVVATLFGAPLVLFVAAAEKIEEKTGWFSKMTDYLFTED